MQSSVWNGSSVVTAKYTWDSSSSALLSDGGFDYVYGLNPNVPIAQIDTSDSVTSMLLSDTNSNIRGLAEISTSAHTPYTLANYTDYDAYGNPISENGGTADPGGLSNEVGTDQDSATRFGFGGGYLDTTGLVYLVNRYYDPTTGEFLSVDPDQSDTGTSYSYASDNPIDNTDQTGLAIVGLCLNGSVSLVVVQFSASACLQRTIGSDGEDDIGLPFTEAFAVGAIASLSPGNMGGGVMVSNANTLFGLHNGFWFVSIYILALSVTFFWNGYTGTEGHDRAIYGATISLDANPIQGGGVVGYSWTELVQFNSPFIADPARWAWDSQRPGVNLMMDAFGGRTGIISRAKNSRHLFSHLPKMPVSRR
jgi:RHS repeat-associated protein